MTTESLAFSFVFATLLGAPILCPVAARFLSRLPNRACNVVAISMAACVVLVAVASCFGVSTPLYDVDLAFLCGSYVAMTTILLLGFKLRHRVIGVGIGIVGILVLLFGVLTGTVGALGVILLIGDSVPVYEVALPRSYRCEVMSYGNATTSANGYEVVLKHLTPILPLLERVSSTARFDDLTYDRVPEELCHRAFDAKAG